MNNYSLKRDWQEYFVNEMLSAGSAGPPCLIINSVCFHCRYSTKCVVLRRWSMLPYALLPRCFSDLQFQAQYFNSVVNGIVGSFDALRAKAGDLFIGEILEKLKAYKFDLPGG